MDRCKLLTGPRWLIAVALAVSIPWGALVRAGASRTFTPTASMNVAREDYAATRLNNGQVLITGGLGKGNYQATAELYDPVKATFKKTGEMTIPRDLHTSTLLADGRV